MKAAVEKKERIVAEMGERTGNNKQDLLLSVRVTMELNYWRNAKPGEETYKIYT